jgi:hypothetical protein
MTRLSRAAGAFCAILMLAVGAARAGDTPVVVELFTSQGCSSCPPADKLFHDLAARDDIIALALHVDYWDYIGWKDAFAVPAHTARQKAYAAAAGTRSIYTPQMIVDGRARVVGSNAMAVVDAIMASKARPSPVDLKISRTGETLAVEAEMTGAARPCVVHLVRYSPERAVEILRGENAGRHMVYANVAQDWQVLMRWDGEKPLRTTAEVPGDLPVVVLIQADGHGPILAGAELR